jgi:hypothetical protein
MHNTDELDALERIVPQDLSAWPPYAQALYLQVQRIGRQVDAIHHTIEGDNGLKDTVKDHERRLKLLEAVIKWAAGLGTALVTYIAIAIAQGRKLV